MQTAQRWSGTIADPLLWRSIGSGAQGVVNAVKQIPSLDLSQLGQQTGQQAQTDWNSFRANPVGSAGQFLASIPGAVAKPFMDLANTTHNERTALQRGDLQGAQSAVDTGTRAIIPALATGAGPAVRGPLAAGAIAAGVTLPQSIDGNGASLQQQLPRALVNTAEAGGLGAGLGLLSRSARSVKPTSTINASARATAAQEARQANMPVMSAALNNGANSDVEAVAPLTMTVARDPIGGIPTRMRLRSATRAAMAQRANLASSLSDTSAPTNLEAAGQTLQSGASLYNAPATPDSLGAFHAANPTQDAAWAAPSRDWGLRTKAAALYQHVLGPIQDNPAPAANASRYLASVQNSIDPAPDSLLAQVRDKLSTHGATSVGDLRLLRERVQSAIDWDNLTPGRDVGQLKQLGGALTQDIYAGAGDSADALRRVDQYYGSGMQRVQTALRPLINAKNPRGALSQLMGWTQNSARQNTENLLNAKRALSQSDWQAVTSSILAHMGDDGQGHFSLTNFAREYGKMDPRGREILFGSTGGGGAHAAQLLNSLDALGRTTQRFAVIRGADNFSGSATHLMGNLRMAELGGEGAMAMLHTPILPVMAALTGARTLTTLGIGEVLTNPLFVRWLAGIPNGPRGLSASLPRLASLAARDPSLVPVYRELSHAPGGANSGQSQQPQQSPQAGRPPAYALQRQP